MTEILVKTCYLILKKNPQKIKASFETEAKHRHAFSASDRLTMKHWCIREGGRCWFKSLLKHFIPLAILEEKTQKMGTFFAEKAKQLPGHAFSASEMFTL